MMKKELADTIKKVIGIDSEVSYSIEGRGDLSSNTAFKLAKERNSNPMKAAAIIREKIKNNKYVTEHFSDISIAEPGFINFTYSYEFLTKQVSEILKHGNDYGDNDNGGGTKVNIEFVSANPTGPLNLGNGRSAFYCATLG